MRYVITILLFAGFITCSAQSDTVPVVDTTLRIINFKAYFTQHVNSIGVYQFEINKPKQNFYWYLRSEPVDLQIGKDNGLLTFRAAKNYFAAGKLRYDFPYIVELGVQRLNDPLERIDTFFTIRFCNSIYGSENIKGKGVEHAVINDYDKALQLSREQNKPILIDYTGWACVNCRKMEEHVWSKPEIAELINDKFILVSLYVDDRKKLPASDQFIFRNKNGEKKIKTVGDKWATFQQENFNQVTQPLYVVLSPDEKLMNNPGGYTPSAEEYKSWLQCGIEAYNAKRNGV